MLVDRVVPVAALLCAACTSFDPDSPPSVAKTSADESDDDTADAPQIAEETLRALEALGYFPSAPTANPDDRGVTSRARTAWPGLNLYSSRQRASAILTDLAGAEVHRWHVDPDQAATVAWMHVEPLPDGHVLIIARDHHVSKRDWNSSLVWRRRMRAHHDLAVQPDGRIAVLVREETFLEEDGQRVPVLADGVALLSPEGQLERTVGLLPLLREQISARRIARIRARLAAGEQATLTRDGAIGDVFHANSIELVHRDIPGIAPAGSFLLSFRALDRVAILSAGLDEVLWIWGEGELDGQHDARQLANGNILLFDNGLRRGEESRVLEIDPASREIVWSYGSPDLFTRLRGGAQPLPNGNVLITESDAGRALEVTREGDVVWEFWNPDVAGHGPDAERSVIYRLNRFHESFFQPLLSG